MILRYWPTNFELKDVMCMRLLSPVFAEALRWRIYTHHPSAARFVAELNLAYVFTNRNRAIGRELYSRAHTMIFNRATERSGLGRDSGHVLARLHLRLCVYMSKEGRVMEKQFDGFVARIATYLARMYTDRFEGFKLQTSFERIRASGGPIKTIEDYMDLARGPLEPIPPEPPEGFSAETQNQHAEIQAWRERISMVAESEFVLGV